MTETGPHGKGSGAGSSQAGRLGFAGFGPVVALSLLALGGAACGDDDGGNNAAVDAAGQPDGAQPDGALPDAAVDPDGSTPPGCVFNDFAAWDVVTALPGARESFATVAHGDHLLVLGGWTPSGATAEVLVSAATADGALGSWQTTTPLPVGLEHLAAVVSGDHVLVLGGDDGAAGHPEVYSATMAGGQLGAWTPTAPLPQARVWHAAAIHLDSVYVIGGMLGFGPVMSTVYRGTLDGAGGVTAWTADRALPQALFGMAAFVALDHLYIVGGATAMGAAVDPVRRAPIAPDGTLGPWETLEPLPQATMTPGALPAGDRLLVLAGLLDFDTATGQTRSLALDATSTQWTDHAPLPDTRFGHGVARVGNYAYVLGGWQSWTTQPTAMQAGVHSARVCE